MNFLLCRHNPSPKFNFFASSIIVQDVYQFLNRDENELMIYMTAIKKEENIFLQKIIPVKAAYRSIGGFCPDPEDSLRKLLWLDSQGHALHATWHIHPGLGFCATKPSDRDEKSQKCLEKGRYEAVMAIFSRDGFVRFLSIDFPFSIHIYGTGVEVVDEDSRIFKISKA